MFLLCRTVTTDCNISNQAIDVKMTVTICKICTAVTADDDYSNQAKEVKMTVY